MDTTTIAIAMVLVRLGIFASLLLIASLWRIFKKAGRPGWPAVVPFYNGYLTMEVAGKPGWWIFLYLVPILDIVIAAQANVALAKKFGKSTGFGVGLMLLPFIFYPILADGEAAYAGTVPAAHGARALPGRRGALLSACLIFFLPFAMFGTAAVLISLVTHAKSLAGGNFALSLALDVAVLIGLVGILKWRKWSVYLYFAATLMALGFSLRQALLAPAQYRVTVPGMVAIATGEVFLVAWFAWAIARAWRHFQSAPGLRLSTDIAGLSAATPKPNEAFRAELMRFLTSDRTKNYERQNGAWWSRHDLELVIAKKYSSNFAADALFRDADAAIDELVEEGAIVGTPSGYRATSQGTVSRNQAEEAGVLACCKCGNANIKLGYYGSHKICRRCGAIYCESCQTTRNGGCPQCSEVDRWDFLTEEIAAEVQAKSR